MKNLKAQSATSSLGSTEGLGKEEEIYSKRFSDAEEFTRRETWEVLCREFFQSYISPNSTVLDLGAGDGNFISNIKAKRRIAVDISAHVLELKKQGIEVIQAPATELARNINEPVDVVFMSNFLEHMPTKQIVMQVIEQCFEVLKPGGKVLILQPNIKYTGASYWDYSDHHVALTDRSIAEALEVSGFRVEQLIPRFLPYTVKSTVGKFAGANLVSIYLKIPVLWRIFGQQSFIVALRPR